MQKIYLNIRGLKNFATDDLMRIQKELPFEIYPALFWESLSELKKKIQKELNKRKFDV